MMVHILSLLQNIQLIHYVCAAVHMTGADVPNRAPRTLFSFNTREDIRQFLTGCDVDIGGTSTVHFDLDESPKHNVAIGRAATGVFHGDMRLAVKTGMEGQIKGGYAAIQSKVPFYLVS